MADAVRILAFAGSAREGSYNKMLVRGGAAAARAAGAQVTILDFRELPLPLFDEDLEASQGAPPNATKLKRLLVEHDGFFISSPEYNSSISGLLKNAIDWASRPAPGEPPLVCFKGKVAALAAASPGAFGGLRGLVTLRSILGNIGAIVLPDQLSLPKAHEAFGPDGLLKDPKQRATLENLAQTLVTMTGKLKAR